MDAGYGLLTQEQGGRATAKKLGFTAVLHREGSASSYHEDFENRPILKTLLAACGRGEVKNIYSYNLDRLSRNETTSQQIRYVLKKNGVTLYTESGLHSLENPQDNFMFSILSAVAVLDNENRLDRLRKGRLESIKKGGWRGGPPPYGYKLESGFLIENPVESRWVKKMYEWFNAGIKIDDIRLKLFKAGVETRRGGTNWGYQTVRNILSSSNADGFHTYTDKKLGETVQATIPRLIDPVLSISVKEKVSRLKVGKLNVIHNSLFKEVMRCGCGSTYGHRFNIRDDNAYYYCLNNTDRHRSGPKGSPKNCFAADGSRTRSLNMPKADSLLWDAIIETLSNSALYKEGIKLDEMGEGKETFDPSSYARSIKKIDKDIRKLKDQKLDEALLSLIDDDNSEIKNVIARIQSKILELESDKKRISKLLNEFETRRVWVDWAAKFHTHIDELKSIPMSLVEKKNFVSGVVETITVKTINSQNHELDVVFKLAFNGSSILYRDASDKSKGYDFVGGKFDKTITLKKTSKTLK